MSKLIVKIDGKSYVMDSKDLKGINKKAVKEEKKVTDEKLNEATETVIKKLGLDKIGARLDDIEKAVEKKTGKKVSALIDLETLMNKSVDEMTSREKIIGFFSALVRNDVPVLKALSEGTPADGGYLFPDEFRAEIIRDIEEKPHMRKKLRLRIKRSLNWVNSGEVLFDRIIPSQAIA